MTAALITMLGSIATTIIVSIATYYLTKLKGSIDAAAKAADVAARVAAEDRKIAQVDREGVRVALESTVALGTEKLDEIHKLVDGKMTEQLRINEDALRKVAGITGKSADIDAADRAGRRVDEQEAMVAAAEKETGS